MAVKGSSQVLPMEEVPKDESAEKGRMTVDTSMVSLSKLFRYSTNRDSMYMVVGTIFAMITGASMPIFTFLFGAILDGLNSADNGDLKRTVQFLALVMVATAVVSFITTAFGASMWAIVGENQSQHMRIKLMQAILKQEVGWFDVNSPGELTTRVATLTSNVQEGLGRKVFEGVQHMTEFFGGFVIALFLSWKLTLVLLGCVPLIGIAAAVMMKYVSAGSSKEQEHYARAGARANEAISAIRTVASLCAERQVINKYDGDLAKAQREGVIKAASFGFGNGILWGVMLSVYAIGFWYGAQLVADDVSKYSLEECLDGKSNGGKSIDCVTGGDVVACFFSVVMGAMGLGQASPSISAVQAARAAAYKIFQIIDRVPSYMKNTESGAASEGVELSSSKKIDQSNLNGRVTFNSVTFAYPTRPENVVFDGMNLEAEPGQVIALVGPSGSGKSSIIGLLLRFYDPQGGSIALDGVPLNELDIHWLRGVMGYVGQEPVLFAGSVADNIRSGKPSATQQEIEEAAKAANAHKFITEVLGDGYDTNVGENGSQLSGGQKQRVAIARAIIRKPKILILDEATSALDNESEVHVQAALNALSCTTFVIAHRLSTIANADKIAVVDQHRIVEEGKHEELLVQKGLYYALVSVHSGPAAGAAKAEETKDESEPSLFDLFSSEQPSTKEIVESTDAPEITLGDADEETGLVKDQEESAADKDGKDDKNENEEEIEKISFKRIMMMTLPDLQWTILGCVGAIGVGAVFPLWGLFLAEVTDVLYQDRPKDIREDSLEYAYIFLGFAAGTFISWIANGLGLGVMGERLTRRLRLMAFEGVLRRDIAFFDREENSTGNLTNRLATDAALVHKGTGDTMGRTIQVCSTLGIGMFMAFFGKNAWKMALCVLALLPIIAVVMEQVMSLMVYGTDDDGPNASKGEAGGLFAMAVTNIRTVTALSLQNKIASDYEALIEPVYKERRDQGVKTGFALGSSLFVIFNSYALVFYVGGLLIFHGEIGFTNMFEAIIVLMLAGEGLGTAMTDMADQKEAIKATRRVFDLVDATTDSPLDPLSIKNGISLPGVKGRIDFSQVKFAYPTRPNVPICGGPDAPEGYQLQIEPGMSMALCGPSGSGKSTAMALLLRFYEADSGNISLDGTSIKDLNLHWLRSRVGYVGQEPALFTGTIRENILMGKPDATDEEIEQAAKLANAHEFISKLPLKYNAEIGEKSMFLSGGQKQRIAIARAIVKNPEILLLDEATSALDNENEQLVQQCLNNLQASRKMTTLVIAHRLTTIKHCDAIAVISDGAVRELGKHDELLAQDGIYASLWRHAQKSMTQ